jgi:leader peptidase (prepilin peptidase)/N-methyltransferase
MVPGLLIPSLLLFGALWLLGVMAAIDIRTQTVLPEYAAVVGVLGALSQTYHYSAALGAAAGAGSILLVMILWRLATGTDGMGGGDAWVAGALGLWLGWPAIVVVLVVAVFAGTFWGIGVTAYAMIRRSDTAHIALPFVPFLALGAVVAVVWGSPIITWYTSFMGIAPL